VDVTTQEGSRSAKGWAQKAKWIARGETGLRKCALGETDAETGKRHTMNILLWVLQVLAALLYGSSGVMKVFMFDKVSQDVPSFGALPRKVWMMLGILELVCTVGLIVPARSIGSRR
jgi:hypothetical protein